jgi:hypothetical protein
LALVASHAIANPPYKRRSRLADIERVRELEPLAVLQGMPANLSDFPMVQEFCREKIMNMDPNGEKGVLSAMAVRTDSMDFLR